MKKSHIISISFAILLLIIIAIGIFLTSNQLNKPDTSQNPRSSADQILEPKYTMKERFGVGYQGRYCDGCSYELIDNFDYQDLGIGWYFDWSHGRGLDEPRTRPGLEYMALVGAYTKADYREWCQELTDFVTPRLEYYPDGLRWTIGNEINFDDGRTWQEYAEQFVGWRDCLKAINPTFEIGTGALVQLNMGTNGNTGQFICVDYNDPDSAENYFKNYINKIRTDYGAEKLPDFIVMHGYTPCDPFDPQPTTGSSPNWTDINLFKESVSEHRKVMKELGLEDKDLIMKEFGPLNPAFYDPEGQLITDPALVSTAVQNYLSRAVDYLATTTNSTYGDPADENRLVQRWAWYVMNDPEDVQAGDPFYFPHLTLYDTTTKQPTAIGVKYKQLIESYTTQAPDPIQIESPEFHPNGGTFSTSVLVTMTSATTGTEIYYTDDGTNPTPSSTHYVNPITLEQTTTLKAIAVKDETDISQISTAVFTKQDPPGDDTYNFKVNIDFPYQNIPINVKFLDDRNTLIAEKDNLYSRDHVLTFSLSSNEIEQGTYIMRITPRYYTFQEKSVSINQTGTINVTVPGKYYGGDYTGGDQPVIDISDLALAVSYFKNHNNSKDLDGDGKFGISDLSIVITGFKAT